MVCFLRDGNHIRINLNNEIVKNFPPNFIHEVLKNTIKFMAF